MFVLHWLKAHSIDVGGKEVTLAALLTALIIIVIGFLLARVISRRAGRWLERAPHTSRWGPTGARLTAYMLRLVAVIVGLQIAGIDIATVIAAGAVFAVGIGIAMQKVAENFVSGMILLAERSIREGDVLEFEGRMARVRQMGIRATIVQTLDDEEIIVPNSMLAQSAVKNLTLSEPLHRLRVKVGVAYNSDLEKVRAALNRAALAMDWRDKQTEPLVLLSEFGDSSIDYVVSVMTPDVWRMRVDQSSLREAIWREFQQSGIVIAFPQVDVHLDAPVVDALARRN